MFWFWLKHKLFSWIFNFEMFQYLLNVIVWILRENGHVLTSLVSFTVKDNLEGGSVSGGGSKLPNWIDGHLSWADMLLSNQLVVNVLFQLLIRKFQLDRWGWLVSNLLSKFNRRILKDEAFPKILLPFLKLILGLLELRITLSFGHKSCSSELDKSSVKIAADSLIVLIWRIT